MNKKNLFDSANDIKNEMKLTKKKEVYDTERDYE